MPGVTTLAFYREKQTIESFETNRPKSLSALRQAALQALESLERDLLIIERAYLGEYNTQEMFIRSHTGFIRLLMDASGYKELRRKNDFEIMWDRVNSLGERTMSYLDFMKRLKNLGAHIAEFNPSAFYEPMSGIEQILRYVDKYCLSFYDGPLTLLSDPVMETPFTYENHRREKVVEIQQLMKKIPQLNDAYGSIGLHAEKFSDRCQQLAGHCDCYNSPFFLLFPESIEILRECLSLLHQWLEEDKEYVDSLLHDIQKFSFEHQQITNTYREIYDRLFKLKHKSDGLNREIEASKEELLELRAKRPLAEADSHEALVNQKKCDLARETAKFRLTELARNATQYSPEEFRQSVEEQRRILRAQRKKLPEMNKLVKRTEKKVQWFDEKENHFLQMQNERKKLLVEIEECNKTLNRTKEKMQKIHESVGKLKVIYNYKASTSTLKKVFHNLQLECRTQFLRREKSLPVLSISGHDRNQDDNQDKLSVAIDVVARCIEQDWCRLYLALPFYPPRGQSELEYDVNKIDKRFVRGLRRELARESLMTWRRLHTRANLDGLKSGLCVIRREDIIRRIDIRLDRKRRSQMDAPPMSPTTRLLARRQRQAAESAPQTARSLPRLLTDDILYA